MDLGSFVTYCSTDRSQKEAVWETVFILQISMIYTKTIAIYFTFSINWLKQELKIINIGAGVTSPLAVTYGTNRHNHLPVGTVLKSTAYNDLPLYHDWHRSPRRLSDSQWPFIYACMIIIWGYPCQNEQKQFKGMIRSQNILPQQTYLFVFNGKTHFGRPNCRIGDSTSW